MNSADVQTYLNRLRPRTFNVTSLAPGKCFIEHYDSKLILPWTRMFVISQDDRETLRDLNEIVATFEFEIENDSKLITKTIFTGAGLSIDLLQPHYGYGTTLDHLIGKMIGKMIGKRQP